MIFYYTKTKSREKPFPSWAAKLPLAINKNCSATGFLLVLAI